MTMKIESPAFTQDDLDKFFDEQLDRERLHLARRLEEASARLAAIAPRITAHEGGEQWSDHEVLAHIAVLSKFYGVMVHKITSGQMTEVDLLDATKLRDVAGEQTAALPTADIIRSIATDHSRTVKLLRELDATALRRTARLPTGEEVTAEFLVRYPLINHLEQHVEQLEQALR
ncbi:MAG: DinB family protein [Chloroflexi bacterium]|nr:MAG: DinB family protein [Chloroflexota bacterium]